MLVGGAAGGVLESAAAAIECPQNLVNIFFLKVKYFFQIAIANRYILQVVAGKLDDKKFMQQQINCILGPDSVCEELNTAI